MALLEVEGLVKYFGRRRVVNGVSFGVDAGEVVGLLGPNGAGKTTSFRMATGQIAPNGGRVIFNSEDVTALPMYQRARRGMGYLSQEPSVFRKLSAEKNLLAILEALPKSRSLNRPLTSAERWERTNAALKRFKLEHVRKNTAGRCSGGEKRRLEIARCLVCEPLLILLDEPFAAVDPITTEDIRRNIRELADSGIGILVTDHNVREVFRTADRVYLITEGQVVTKGTPHELVNDEIAIKAYLGRSFEEDGFTRHFAARANRSASDVLGGEDGVPAPPQTATATLPSPFAFTPTGIETPPPVGSLSREAWERSKSAAVGIETPPPVGSLSPHTVAPKEPDTTDPTNPPAVLGSPVGVILEIERLRNAIEKLAHDATLKTAMIELVARGGMTVPLLLEALERREPVLRRRAYEVLKVVDKDAGTMPFDFDAPDDVRLRQVAYLRARLERKD